MILNVRKIRRILSQKFRRAFFCASANFQTFMQNNEPSESSSGGKSLSRLQNRNVFVLGLAFLLLYTAFQTMNGILQTVLDSYYTQHPDHGAEVNGLVSLGIFYGVCAISVWFAPWVITLMSPKAVMVMGALINTAYMTLFISAPNAPLVYIFSVLIGIAGAFIWVGQGTVLITNSNPETISRNTGIFFLMFESSLFVGNTFIYFTFDGAEYISDSTRVVVFSCLTAVSFLGLLTLFLIRPLPTTSQESENESDTAQLVGDGTQEVTQSKWNKASESAKTAFLNAIRILKTEQVLLQLVVWAYNGLEITFWSGILPTCIGNTMALPNRYSVVGLAGIVVGVGEMLGAFLTMITGRRSDPPRGPLIIFGMLCQGIGFYLCLLYLPDDSTTTRVGTFSPTWAEPSTASILTTAFFLGLGDSMYQNQIVSLIGLIFPEEENASASFALFQFVQALAAASAFFYSVYVGLMYQLLILVVFMLVGTACFLYLEVKYAKKFPVSEES